MTALPDYPSQREGSRWPPDPILLDTCIVQALREATDCFDANGNWELDAPEELLARHGECYGSELIALGNVVELLHYSGPPWLVSQTSLLEFERARPEIASGLLSWWLEWADYMEASAVNYPELDLGALFPGEPELVEGQLQLPFITPRVSPLEQPSFPPFKHGGDCALVRDALRAGVPAILTLDLRSFWRHRRHLYPLGIELWRPSDYWHAIRSKRQTAA